MRSARRCAPSGRVALGVLAGVLGLSEPARASPDQGEARSILDDPDRPYTVVAGEGDAASTVTNPANLGFLRGVNAVFDIAWTAPRARRRGSGLGLFLGVPLPFRIAALGFGYQYIYPVQPEPVGSAPDQPQGPDDPYNKFTLALAVPLERWIRGLSIGLDYSRLWSSTNFHADGINQVDLGLSWWANRFLALALVGRGLNTPHTGPGGSITQPLIVEPALAVRPFGDPRLELAGSVGLAPRVPSERRFHVYNVQPRGRVFVTLRGVRFFAEVSRMRYLPDPVLGAAARDGALVTAGFELAFPHVGVAGALLGSAGGESSFGVDGGAGRIRVSQERYQGFVVAPRRVTRLQLSKFAGERGMWKVIELLDQAGARGDAVLVETEGMTWGWAQLEEVREAIHRARGRGAKVAAYMSGGSLRHYFVAAAAERIIARPQTSLSILGMRVEAFYFRDLLAKLGAKAEFVRIAEYKSAPETYERASGSEPAKRQRKLLVTDLWNHVLRMIAQDRGHDPLVVKDWIDDAPLHPPEAVGLGVVDELAHPDEVDDRLEAWLGRKVRLEQPPKPREHAHAFGPPPRVAVVIVEGDLYDSESFEIPLVGRKIAGSHTITKVLEKLRKDKGIEAVVVRCNTPGGSVSASAAIARELDLLRKEKPVVISMSNACASGGYYLATAGQYIFADATTVTGSIGIFHPKMDLSGTLEKLGVGVDRWELGDHAAMRSWWKPYTDQERAAAMQDIQNDYAIFTRRVAKARNMTLTQVNDVARGRIWSGVRGMEVGLVDAYGGLREAVIRARAIAGLDPGEGAVELYPPPPGVLENLRRLFDVRLPSPLSDGGAGLAKVPASVAAAKLGLPIGWLVALRHLPAPLWLMEAPVPMALAEETVVVAD